MMKDPDFRRKKRVLAIVPAYNEEDNVAEVVREIIRKAPFCDVLVVDDGSQDRTRRRALAAGAMVVSHPVNLGVGGAVQTGMEFALSTGYDIVVQIDGDGQHDPGEVHNLLVPLARDQTDVVIGSRFLGATTYKVPWSRRAGIRFLSLLLSFLTGSKVTDATSGFRAMNREAMRFLAANYPDDYPEPETPLLMHLGNIRWKEVPVTMRPRMNGKSTISRVRSIYFMLKVTVVLLLEGLRVKVPRQLAGDVEI